MAVDPRCELCTSGVMPSVCSFSSELTGKAMFLHDEDCSSLPSRLFGSSCY